MTSNLGAHLIQEKISSSSDMDTNDFLEHVKPGLMELLKNTIRPEFLNRIDETIVFTPLNAKDIREIVKLQFEQVLHRLKDSGVKIDLTEEAINWLGKEGFDPHFGARPVKRILQKYLLNELSKKILAGEVEKDQSITIDAQNDRLVFMN